MAGSRQQAAAVKRLPDLMAGSKQQVAALEHSLQVMHWPAVSGQQTLHTMAGRGSSQVTYGM